MEPVELVHAAVEKAGSSRKLCNVLGISTSSLSRWKHGQCLTGENLAMLSAYYQNGTTPTEKKKECKMQKIAGYPCEKLAKSMHETLTMAIDYYHKFSCRCLILSGLNTILLCVLITLVIKLILVNQ